MQGARRRLQPTQEASSADKKSQRILRRLHSQQDCVPLRIFLRFAETSCSSSTPEVFIMAGVCEWGTLFVDKDTSPMLRGGENAGDFMRAYRRVR